MQKMFTISKEGHDCKGRTVFVCSDANGLFVYKPSTGYASRHFTKGDAAIEAAFDHQVACGHNGPWYLEGHAPLPNEVFPDFEAVWAKLGNTPPKKTRAKKTPTVTGTAAKKGTEKKVNKKREG
jgi:hypothetical protein